MIYGGLTVKDKVAIILSAYNGEKYIAEQIESLTKQTYKSIDIFIHDDGSTDSTLDIVKKYVSRYSNIFLIVRGTGYGYPGCFIEMLKQIDGYDYYSFSDQDDVWDTLKIETAVKCLNDYDENKPLLYYTAVDYCDSKLNYIRKARYAKGKEKIQEQEFCKMLFGGEAMGMTFVFNKKARNALIKANEKGTFKDWFLKLYCAACGSVIYNPHSSAKYRRHEMAVTNSSNPSGKIDRYLSQIREIYFNKNSFDNQKKILSYLISECWNEIEEDNNELIRLFTYEDGIKLRLNKTFYRKAFRNKLIDEFGYRIAFLLGRI